MFSFCSQRVKPLPPTGNLFFQPGVRQDIREAEGCVDVGENDLPEGGRF
jgi:hypothetical protein